eukprot:scaffold68832_cov45-Prasinocladus_malaysianus.AAC.1
MITPDRLGMKWIISHGRGVIMRMNALKHGPPTPQILSSNEPGARLALNSGVQAIDDRPRAVCMRSIDQ